MREYNEQLVRELERKNAELARDHDRLQKILTLSPSVFYRIELERQIFEPQIISDNVHHLLGYTLEEARRPGWWESILFPGDREAAKILPKQFEYREHLQRQFRLRHAQGHYVWINDKLRPNGSSACENRELIGVWTDITRHKELQAKIERLNRVHAMLSSINSLILRAEDRQSLFNEACRIAIDYGGFEFAWIGMFEPGNEQLVSLARAGDGAQMMDLLEVSAREDSPGGKGMTGRALRSQQPQICNDLENDTGRVLLRDRYLADGFRAMCVLPLVVSGKAVGVLHLYSAETNAFDDTEMRLLDELSGDISFALDYLAKQDQIKHLASYDPLTGLPNRSLLVERMNEYLAFEADGKLSLALAVIDLEHFHRYSETLGRVAADKLLKLVATRLRQAVSEFGSVARIHADLFAVMLPGAPSALKLGHLLEDKIIHSLKLEFRVDGQTIKLSPGAGLAFYPDDGSDPATLIGKAETALRQARSSNDAYLFYAPKMNAKLAERQRLENKLREAIERKQITLRYQPRYKLQDNSICGYVAQLHWDDPDHQMLSSKKFMSVLEGTDLIAEAGALAMQKAVAQCAEWNASGEYGWRIAVKVLLQQLERDDFVDTVREAIAVATSADHGLDFEISESTMIYGNRANIAKLEEVRALGVGITIDDFGTGYSSLKNLTRMPIDALKIDRDFVSNMATEANNMTMVSTIISLAHSLGFSVVAEGVGNETQAKFLRLLKCDAAQGPLFGEALPVDRIELDSRSADAAPQISAGARQGKSK